mmetsp:Transcript_38598/g.46696  ORF Transcript_38598/g.46696 Transcript_38598/m.46696 type:complete len:257 (-) Transcript_38598:199-969(-)|eukprot:CAMPEP_0197847228 /NCGR_PEP_ID=MMETSP1438-20131217/5617_1 /TAXON_ID=1461541 /ORGANISM="Pterosperma sp., Strain CCMP1384" /LENGTH=256 /DNA_ID=CAMNT_0043459091 /DNA_START=65 /DNA_END=835 /DNA_ORIENTATION=-
MSRLMYNIGFMVRETGQAMDRLGMRLQGNGAFKEQLNRHRTVMNIFDKVPSVDDNSFVAPNASVIGDVSIGANSSVWYGCVLRGDVNSVRIGSGTNIQDNTVVHVSRNNAGGVALPTIIGNNVTVGHAATLHACTVEDSSFVGMGATLMDGVKVESGAMVAAGAVVTQGTTVPTGQIWAGSPAKFLRKLTEQERSFLDVSADNYADLALRHAAENRKSFEQIEQEKWMRKRDAERDPDYDSHLGMERPPNARSPTV